MGKGCVINWRWVDNTYVAACSCLYHPTNALSHSLYNGDSHILACESVPPNWQEWLLSESCVRYCGYTCSSVLAWSTSVLHPALRLIETEGGVEEGEEEKEAQSMSRPSGWDTERTHSSSARKQTLFTNWGFLMSNTEFMTYIFFWKEKLIQLHHYKFFSFLVCLKILIQQVGKALIKYTKFSEQSGKFREVKSRWSI